MFKKSARFAFAHKIMFGLAATALAAGGWLGYGIFGSGNGEIRYVLAAVERGTLTSSVSGSGQISASQQVDIKAKVSGDVVSVGAKNGQSVRAGTILVQLDARDAEKLVRDAEANLEAAKLSLEKLKKPADALSLLQARNALAQTEESKTKAEDDLAKSYEDGFSAAANAFLDLPTVMTGLRDILYNPTTENRNQTAADFYTDSAKTYDEKALRFRDETFRLYQSARASYDAAFTEYRVASRMSERVVIESLIENTYETTRSIAEALKSATNLIQFYQDKFMERNLKPIALSDSHLSALAGHTSKTNTHLSTLLSTKRAIENAREASTNADRLITERTEALTKLRAGTDALDIQSQELAVRQRENVLADAREKLADYKIRAPFDGAAGNILLKKGDTVSSGAQIATIITSKRIAEITLNEVDIAEVAQGQKAELEFDALPDLKLQGKIAEVDPIGAVLQGVVSYTAKIAFETKDQRIKPGMSVSATIITREKPNVLMVPNSAIKSQSETKYVEVPAEEITRTRRSAAGVILSQAPQQREVAIGASNDEFTEIVSGLEEEDFVVTHTLTGELGAQTTQTRQQPGTFRLPGLQGGRR